MNLTIIAYLAAAASIFAGGYRIAWTIQAANITELELSYANSRIAVQREARSALEAAMQRISAAQTKAQNRADRLAVDHANATSALDGLRTASAAALRAAASDLSTCNASLSTHSVVLSQCSGRLVEVARDADDWASYGITLQDAAGK